jgi:transcription elongation factor GreA
MAEPQSKIPMTPRGLQLLKDELKRRKEVTRHKIVKDIEEARAHGDLSENAEYSAAKEAQSFNEGRIRELEGTIALANVIDPSKLSGSKIVFGATVSLTDTDSGEEVVYTIVGEHEADIKQKRIAITAPIARALIGREVGDTVTVKTPKGGSREYEIQALRFVAVEGSAEEA